MSKPTLTFTRQESLEIKIKNLETTIEDQRRIINKQSDLVAELSMSYLIPEVIATLLIKPNITTSDLYGMFPKLLRQKQFDYVMLQTHKTYVQKVKSILLRGFNVSIKTNL